MNAPSRIAIVLSLALVAACGGSGANASTAGGGGAVGVSSGGGAAVSAAGAPSDPQIMMISSVSHDAEIQQGELARTRAADPRVRAFAEQMVTEHTAARQREAELGQRLGVSPAPSETSDTLTRETAAAMQRLSARSGADFDRDYVAQQITDHQRTLASLDSMLIPNAQNPDLRAALQALRPVVAQHLDHARQLQAQLGGGAGAGAAAGAHAH